MGKAEIARKSKTPAPQLLTEAEATPRTREQFEAVMTPIIEACLLVMHYTGDSALLDFVRANGRLPFATDEVKPWKYRGWMLPQVVLVQRGTPGLEDRYSYLIRTLQEGRLLDEPIPEILYNESTVIEGSERHRHHITPAHGEVYQKLDRLCNEVGRWHGYYERALSVFIDWLAWALGVEDKEPSFIKDETSEYLYHNFNFGDWLLSPSDYLGALLTEYRSHSSKQRSGFFVTPHNICELMVRMVGGMKEDMDLRSKTVYEPAVGTGRFLLHMANVSMRLYGQDIDPTCVKVTKCNLALYAPWGVWPLPARFWRQYDEDAVDAPTLKCGDTLLEPMTTPVRRVKALLEASASTPPPALPKSPAVPAAEASPQPAAIEELPPPLFSAPETAEDKPKAGVRGKAAPRHPAKRDRPSSIHESQGSLFQMLEDDES